jgi:hypothetical protein
VQIQEGLLADRGQARLIAEVSVLPRFERSYSFLELLQYLDGVGFEIHQVLTANRDPQGLIRFLDVAFVPKRERTGRR